jgi:hypothetical protein
MLLLSGEFFFLWLADEEEVGKEGKGGAGADGFVKDESDYDEVAEDERAGVLELFESAVWTFVSVAGS